MGVRGLKRVFLQISGICRSFKLFKTPVIIDGTNFLYSIYCSNYLDFKFGGEYERFYDCIRKFLANFLECGIKPIIIMDGCQKKTTRRPDSVIERSQKSLERSHKIYSGKFCPYPVFPLFIYQVFKKVLSDLGIQFANCDYDADGQVAALGNYYDCPVISNDSDFFIFDVHKGFIILDSIDPTIKIEVDCDGKIYKYISCQMYNIHDFVNLFPGLDKNILPLFGTLIKTEYDKPEMFHKLLSKIQLPSYKGSQLTFDLKHKNVMTMMGFLCWLQNKTVNETVSEVISYFEKSEKHYVKNYIKISVSGYKLNSCRLKFIFDQNINDPGNELLSNSMLTTPCGKKLPENFVLKFHQVRLPNFCIHSIVLHRVLLQATVQDMELKSSHSCSFYIRKILYGILVRHDINGTECRNPKCLGFIEEYDRHGRILQKEQVLPLFELEGIGQLPKVNELHDIDKETCIAIIAKALCVGSDFFNHIPEEWQLFLGSVNYWLRVSGCRSDAFLSAVILNLVHFGFIKCKKKFLYKKLCPKKLPTSNKCSCSSISCIAARVSESDLKYARKVLDKYYTNPTLKQDRRLFLSTAHSFSQMQSCLLHITYLNEILNECFENPAPENCFSGTLIFNLTKTINSCSFPKLFLAKILGEDLNLLFTLLKSKACQNVPDVDI